MFLISIRTTIAHNNSAQQHTDIVLRSAGFVMGVRGLGGVVGVLQLAAAGLARPGGVNLRAPQCVGKTAQTVNQDNANP